MWTPNFRRRSNPFSIVALLLAPGVSADTLPVPSAAYPTIQSALDAAQPGDRIEVAEGTYAETLVFPTSGTPGSPITLTGAGSDPEALPQIDAAGLAAAHVIFIENKSHLRVQRLEIRDHDVINDGSAVRIEGSGTDLQIRDLVIRGVTGTNAMGITVYGTEATAISDLVISGNVLRDIDAAPSEALVLNGNVDGFVIENNLVRDVGNIGIDLIGGETDIQPNPSLVARNGIVRGNEVRAANGPDGFAAGIYVDGGRDILIEANRVEGCDLGIEIGAENAGIVVTGVTVRNNQLTGNEKAGIVFGGYQASVGRVNDTVFRGNTLVENNTLGSTGDGIGEIWAQWGEGNLFEHNLVVAGPPDYVVVAGYDVGSAPMTQIDDNLYWSTDPTTPGAGSWVWNAVDYASFGAWQTGTGFDAATLHQDPLLVLELDTDTYRPGPGSPAIDAAPVTFTPDPGELDIDLDPRLAGFAVDLGADEVGSETIFADGFEEGDVSAWTSSVP